MLPLKYAGYNDIDAISRASAVLTQLGLKDRIDHGPSELSGGQQQRVATAANKPSILFADEPTGILTLKQEKRQ